MSPLPQCTALARISRGFIIVSSRGSEVHIQPLQEIAVWLPLLFLCHTSSFQGQFCDPGDCPRIPLRWQLLYFKCAVLGVQCRWICEHPRARLCSGCLMLQQKIQDISDPWTSAGGWIVHVWEQWIVPKRNLQDAENSGQIGDHPNQWWDPPCSHMVDSSEMFSVQVICPPQSLTSKGSELIPGKSVPISDMKDWREAQQRGAVWVHVQIISVPFSALPPSTLCSGILWAPWQHLTQTIFSNWSACP